MRPRRNTLPPGMRVLVSGCLPPPMGGMATFYETLLDSSLPSRVNLAFVRTSSPGRLFERSGRVSLSNLILSFADCWRFARAMLVHRPMIAHIGTAYGTSFVKHSICVMVARAFGSKVLLHPHCSYLMLYKDRSRLWQWYFRHVISLADGIIALSQEWLALALIVPHARVYLLPNAVTLHPYRQIAEERMTAELKARALHVLYLGHIGRAKGSFDLVAAARSVLDEGRRYEFELVGGANSPGEWAMLQREIQAADLEEQVHIRPPVTGSGKLAAYRWADVFVYPSHHEGMPMAVIEAMACGLPVVASRVGGLPDLITDGVTGLLVDPGHPEQMAAALCRLADQPMLRAAMAHQSYRRAADDYDFEDRVEELVSLYSTILHQSREARD